MTIPDHAVPIQFKLGKMLATVNLRRSQVTASILQEQNVNSRFIISDYLQLHQTVLNTVN